MYVCVCHGVTERHIEQAVNQGATRLRDLRRNLRVATGCGLCASCARDCLKDSLASQQPNDNSIMAITASRSLPALT